MSHTRIYGRYATLHRTRTLNVEVDKKGNVVSVWFRCTMLPFSVHPVNEDRAIEMEMAYKEVPDNLIAVEFEEEDDALPNV